jgi:hypothetical protein
MCLTDYGVLRNAELPAYILGREFRVVSIPETAEFIDLLTAPARFGLVNHSAFQFSHQIWFVATRPIHHQLIARLRTHNSSAAMALKMDHAGADDPGRPTAR